MKISELKNETYYTNNDYRLGCYSGPFTGMEIKKLFEDEPDWDREDDYDLDEDWLANIKRLSREARGLHYESAAAKHVLDQEDWAGVWPVIDSEGILTGEIVDSADDGYCNVDDMAMIHESELTDDQVAATEDGYVNLEGNNE